MGLFLLALTGAADLLVLVAVFSVLGGDFGEDATAQGDVVLALGSRGGVGKSIGLGELGVVGVNRGGGGGALGGEIDNGDSIS